MSEEITAPLTWISPSEFELDGLSFTCDFTSHLNGETDEQSIITAKSRGLIDSLYKHLFSLAIFRINH